MKKNSIFSILFFATAFITIPLAQAGTPAVIMPGADLVLKVDLAKMRHAPIGKRFKELEALKKELGQPDNMDKMGEFDKKLTQITGLKEDDFLQLTAAVEMDALDLVNGKEPDLVNADAVLGVTLAKVLTDDQLETGLKAFAQQLAVEKKWKTVPSVTKTKQNGLSVFKAWKPDENTALYFTVVDNGKALLMGTETGITHAVARQTQNETTQTKGLFTPAIESAVQGADFSLIFRPTDDMRAKMRESAEKPNIDGNAAMFGKVFSQMKGLGLAITSTDTMDIALTGDFADKAVAEQTRQLMDSQVISMVKMIASMAAGGKNMPFLQTMKASAAENGTAKMTVSITGKDVDVFKEIIKTQAGENNGNDMDDQMGPDDAPTDDQPRTKNAK